MAALSRIGDPNERRLWLREAVRRVRGDDGLTLRAPFRPRRGHGETYAFACRRLAAGWVWPVGLRLVEVTPSGALTARADMAALDFATLYGFADFAGGWLRALSPRGLRA